MAAPKAVEGNGLLSFVEHVLLPASELLDRERIFKIEWDGQTYVYNTFESLRDDYAADKVSWLYEEYFQYLTNSLFY